MPPPRPLSDPIIAVGLLTQRDVEVLGAGFRRILPLDGTDMFDDLIAQLDRIELDAGPAR